MFVYLLLDLWNRMAAVPLHDQVLASRHGRDSHPDILDVLQDFFYLLSQFQGRRSALPVYLFIYLFIDFLFGFTLFRPQRNTQFNINDFLKLYLPPFL